MPDRTPTAIAQVPPGRACAPTSVKEFAARPAAAMQFPQPRESAAAMQTIATMAYPRVDASPSTVVNVTLPAELQPDHRARELYREFRTRSARSSPQRGR